MEESFEKIVSNLKDIVLKMESGELTLEQSLQTFEEGIFLAKKAEKILNSAQQKIDMIESDEIKKYQL